MQRSMVLLRTYTCLRTTTQGECCSTMANRHLPVLPSLTTCPFCAGSPGALAFWSSGMPGAHDDGHGVSVHVLMQCLWPLATKNSWCATHVESNDTCLFPLAQPQTFLFPMSPNPYDPAFHVPSACTLCRDAEDAKYALDRLPLHGREVSVAWFLYCVLCFVFTPRL